MQDIRFRAWDKTNNEEKEAKFDIVQIGQFCLTMGINIKNIEIIGNIYENPELLEGKK